MLDFLKSPTEVASAHEDPKIRDVNTAVTSASAELQHLRMEEAALQRIVDPPPQASHAAVHAVRPEDYYDAEARLPQVRRERQKLESQVHRLNRELATTRETAKHQIDNTRQEVRKPLVAEVFARLADGEAAARRLSDFDQETLRLGGSYTSPPCPQLLSGCYDDQREMAERSGWL